MTLGELKISILLLNFPKVGFSSKFSLWVKIFRQKEILRQFLTAHNLGWAIPPDSLLTKEMYRS